MLFPRGTRLALLAVMAASVWIGAGTAGELPAEDRRSGYDQMSREIRAMQDDDTENPGMLWVLDGQAAWRERTGERQRSCADCHGQAEVSMKGVAARYPAFDRGLDAPINLDGRINRCRIAHQDLQPLAPESRPLLALSAYVARQSRGLPIAADDPAMEPFRRQGRAIFELRQGQLNLSCANCHNDNWGRKLAGSTIPQGHPTGYPLYRLEWQTIGSLQRRLRNCLTGMRAVSYPLGAPELVALESYLMWRARGLKIDAPAVRP